MVHSVDVQGQFVRTETSSGSNSAPAQPEKTNEQSNVRSAVIALVAGAVGLSPTILWAMPQPGTCGLLSDQPKNLASVRYIELFQENRVGLLRCQTMPTASQR